MTTRSMLNFGLRSALNAATSSSLTSGLRGAGVAPNLRIAKNATTNSTPLGNSMATRSPATTPWVARSRANPAAKASSSDQVSLSSPQSSADFRAETARIGFDRRRRSSGAWPIRKSRWPEYWSDGVMECWGPEFLASLHDSSTPSFQPDLLVREIFEVNALPDFARNTMARRVSGEGRLGCGIDAPLCGVAVFLG